MALTVELIHGEYGWRIQERFCELWDLKCTPKQWMDDRLIPQRLPPLTGQHTTSRDISFSQLLNEVDQGRVRDVLIQGPEIRGTFTDGGSFQTYSPSDPSLIQHLYNKGVSITARPKSDNVPWLVSLLISWLPLVALIVFLSLLLQGIARPLTEAHGPEDRFIQDIKDLLAQTKSNLAGFESGDLLHWADNTDAASAWFKRNIVMYEAILDRFEKQSGREKWLVRSPLWKEWGPMKGPPPTAV